MKLLSNATQCVDHTDSEGLYMPFLLMASSNNSPLHTEDTIPHVTTQSDTVLSGSIEFSFTPLSHKWSKLTLVKEHIWCSTYRRKASTTSHCFETVRALEKKAHSLKCPPTKCACTHTHTNTAIVWQPYPPKWMPLSWRPHNDSKFHLIPNLNALLWETKNRQLNSTQINVMQLLL